jgi:hypothetical protein
MTPKDFRRIALALPDTSEGAHGGHPDFRVGKKVFASLGYPDAASAMVKLAPEQQAVLVAAEPKVFVPVPGGWGRNGSTNVRLAAADAATLESALAMAWRNVAPKTLLQRQVPPRRDRAGPRIKDAAKVSGTNPARAVARMRAAMIGSKLPDIEEGTAYGTPSLKLRGKFLTRVKDADTLVFRCPIEMKEVLIESAPDIYFETDHYKGWPAVLVRLSKVGDAELQECLRRAWRLQAPKRLLAQHEGGAAEARKRKPRKPGKR